MKYLLLLLLMAFGQEISVANMPKSKMPAAIIITLDRLTVYNPLEDQTDSDPLITASNAKINLTKLKTGKIKWMAISRDMLKRWGGKVKYGDSVYIKVGDPAVDGYWIIQDTMNKRFKKSGDLLFHEKIRSSGKWNNVKIFVTSIQK